MITLLFIFVAVPSVSVAHYLRVRFSGPDLKTHQAIGCFFYNCVFCFYYLELAKYGCITFYGCFTDLEEKYPIIAWGSFLCFILHGLAHPMEWTPRIRFRRKFK